MPERRELQGLMEIKGYQVQPALLDLKGLKVIRALRVRKGTTATMGPLGR